MYFVHKELWHGLFRAAISIGLLLGLLIILYQKSTTPLSSIFDRMSLSELLVMTLFLISTSVLNWALESLKWRLVTNDLVPHSFRDSFKEVLTGVAFSLITPNRTGEFFGRVALWKPKLAIQGSLRNSYNSIAQSLVTIVLGSIAFMLSPFSFQSLITGLITFAKQNTIIITCVIIVAAIATVWYGWKSKTSFQKILTQLPSDISTKLKLYISLISFGRYAVFSCQFVAVLIWLDVALPVTDMFIAISLGYLFLFAIPSVALGELGIREVSFVGVFAMYHIEALPIAGTSLIIWGVNLLLPALFGYLFYLKGKRNSIGN